MDAPGLRATAATNAKRRSCHRFGFKIEGKLALTIVLTVNFVFSSPLQSARKGGYDLGTFRIVRGDFERAMVTHADLVRDVESQA